MTCRLTYLLLMMLLASPVAAAEDEFMLGLQHPTVGGYFVNALYNGTTGEVYLPLTELLGLLQMPYGRGEAMFSLQGRYPATQEYWEVNLTDLVLRKGKAVFGLTTDDYRIKDHEWFLLPGVFAQVFGLHFSINMTVFRMTLVNDYPLPAEERQQREQMRTAPDSRMPGEDHPLLYPRNRQFAGAGMLDYNLSSGLASNDHFHTYTLVGGMEVFGGDIQGSLKGTHSDRERSIRAGNIHWRFVPGENPYLTAIRAGQISTTGLQPHRIIGGSITNDPVIPRRTFETFIIDGTTDPDSEVELYVNSSLADFTVADELGYFRFDYPLNYGTALMSLRIYKPTGEMVIQEQRVHIPFTFLPVGVLTYNIQGGYAADAMGNPDTGNLLWHGDLAYGLSPGLTLKAGVDQPGNGEELVCYASISARIFRQYLLNIDAAPGFYYRASTSVYLPGGRNFNLLITHFDGQNILNTRNSNQHLQASFHLPFRLFGASNGLRVGGEHFLFDESFATTYRSDLSLRFQQANVRLNYRGQLAGIFDPELLLDGLLTTSATYGFGRGQDVSVLLRGTRIRLQGRYDAGRNDLVDLGVQIARNIGRRGRFTLDAEHNLRNNATMLRLGFIIDTRAMRSNTQATARSRDHVLQQTLSGSIGLDTPNRQLVASNRHQVGQAAASVMAFVDGNNNGRFDPGEELVPLRNININGGTGRQKGMDGIIRISQLQNYWRYNVELKQSDIPNPTLTPLVNEFSFVADPNRYKQLQIPLYRTGIISGYVKNWLDKENYQGMGGVRLLLTHLDTNEKNQIRTFNNGSFYAMHLMPGLYSLEVEPSVLEFTGKVSEPIQHLFTVQALADGHFIEELDFLLIPACMDPFQKLLITMTEQEQLYHDERLTDINCHFNLFSLAQEAFYDLQFEKALTFINNSLSIFETDYALALKGSILYALNKPEEALRLWELASSRNPHIEIPELF